MRRFLTTALSALFVVFLIAGAVEAQDFSGGFVDRAAVIATARKVTRDKYPNADEVVIDRTVWVKYNADGTHTQWAEEYVKSLTEKGRRRHRTISTYFTAPYQRGVEDCSIPLLEIIKADGTVVPIDVKKNSKLMINPSGMGSNIYNPNSKVIRVNIAGFEVGDTLHYVMFDRIVQPRVKNSFCDWLSFEGQVPIIHSVVKIIGPKDMPLRSIAIKGRVGKTLVADKPVEKDGLITYRWEASNVPRMFREPDMPPVYMVTQRLLVSTSADWQAISKWYWKLSNKRYSHTPEIKAKVDELVKGKKTRREKIASIFKFVSQEIRYMGITTEHESPGYEPHEVADTFNQKHGVCRDKAALLVVMLRLAGFEAFPVLIHNGAKKDTEVPQPYFNHAISCVRNADGSYQLMDSTDENTRQLLPAYLNNKSFLVACPEGDMLRTSAIEPAEKNLLRIETTGTIAMSGNLRAETVLHFGGINDNAYRGYFSRIKPEMRKRYFEGAIQKAAAGARITDIDIQPKNMMDTSKPLTVRISFEAPDTLVRGGGHIMLPLPALGQRIGMANFIIGKTGLKVRKYPMMTGYACGVSEKIEMKLPPTLGKVIAVPNCQPIVNDALSWKMDVSCTADTLKATGDFRLNVAEFSPEQYLVLKDTLKRIERDLRKMPILSSTQSRSPGTTTTVNSIGGDVYILDNNVRYKLTDIHNWTETRSVKKAVLTYAGKKKSGELKIRYNPAWEEIKLLKAVVTSRSGKSHKINDKEINIMDAPGSAAAPRYPVQKVFVASLPGVEVGSIIEYTYVRTCKNRPFFAMREAFQGFDALKKKTVTVTAVPEIKLQQRVIESVKDGTPKVVGRRFSRRNHYAHTWTIADTPALKKEDMLPPLWSFTPTVMVSTGNWQSYAGQVYVALHKNTVGQTAAFRKARELVGGEDDEMKKIKILRDFIAVNIREAGPGLTDMSTSYVSPADVTLKDGYGNSTDRAVLLYVMLKAVWFNPEFVLATGTPVVKELQELRLGICDPDLVGSVLVRVKSHSKILYDLEGPMRRFYRLGIIYLNDSDQYAALGTTRYDGRAGIVLPGGEIETIRSNGYRSDRSDTSYSISVGENGDATITRTDRIHGTEFGPMNRKFSEMRPEDRKRYHQELVASISQNAEATSELKTDFSKFPGIRKFSVKVKNFAVRDGDYLYFQLPESLKGLFWLRSDSRENPMYLGIPDDVKLRIEVHFPKTFQTVRTPQAFIWQTPYGSVEVGSHPHNRGTSRNLVYVGTAKIKATVIAPVDYPALFEFNRKISHTGARMILLKKRGPRRVPK